MHNSTTIRTVNIFFTVAIVLGLIILSISAFITWDKLSLINKSQKLNAIVIKIDTQDDIDGKTQYSPILKFKDNSGTIREINANFYMNPLMYEVGEKISVYYINGENEKVLVDGFIGLWSYPAFLATFGILFTAFGFLCKCNYIEPKFKC